MMSRLRDEYPELKQRYGSKRRENSFYMDMGPMEEPPGSSNAVGGFVEYTYHLDSNSHKIICTKIR